MVGRAGRRPYRRGREGRATEEAAHHDLSTDHPRDRDRATKWLQTAISRCQFDFVEGDKRFPKHVWYVDSDGQGWAGRCINSVSGAYKGWPVGVDEMNRMKNRGR